MQYFKEKNVYFLLSTWLGRTGTILCSRTVNVTRFCKFYYYYYYNNNYDFVCFTSTFWTQFLRLKRFLKRINNFTNAVQRQIWPLFSGEWHKTINLYQWYHVLTSAVYTFFDESSLPPMTTATFSSAARMHLSNTVQHSAHVVLFR